MSVLYEISESDSKFLKPQGSGLIDVLDMAWTLSPKSVRKNVPYALLTEYQQTTGQLLASILYYGRLIARSGGDDDDIYKYKYFAEPTGFTYKFPYFNTIKTSRTNTFGYEQGKDPVSSALGVGAAARSFGTSGKNLGKLGKFFKGESGASGLLKNATGLINTLTPGAVNFETPKSWSDSGVESYTIEFDLFNTGTVDELVDNRNLCYILTYQNSPSRRNFAIIDPPAIYSLNIPDVVQMPACWMSSLNITNLGNTRVVFNKTIPEAYKISMTFTSLMLPSRNILLALDKNKVVEAISDIGEFNAMADDALKAIIKQGEVDTSNSPPIMEATNNTQMLA
jgi:hypothetical protein